MTNNSPFSLEEKTENEKRKRNQIYIALDSSLSLVTYFDFFSLDAFEIATHSRYLSFLLNQKAVKKEILFLSFFHFPNEIIKILEELNVDQKFIIESLLLPYSIKKDFSYYLTKIKKFLINFSIEKKVDSIFSNEISLIFEKAAENALTRFKTPVITSEILFLTLIEEKNTIISRIFKKAIKREIDWYLLRYRIIKQIHFSESSIRADVIKNQQYFSYLLETQLNEAIFKELIIKKRLQEGTSIFRNSLITKTLEIKFFDIYFSNIVSAMKIRNTRKYSSSKI